MVSKGWEEKVVVYWYRISVLQDENSSEADHTSM
jgi:hypothetical protein